MADEILKLGQAVTAEIVKRIESMNEEDKVAEMALILSDPSNDIAAEDMRAMGELLGMFFSNPERYSKVPDGKTLRGNQIPFVQE